MDKYLNDLKNAVNSISAESDLTERAVSRVRNSKRNADSSELNFSSVNSGDKKRYIQTDIKKAEKGKRIIPVVTAACLIAGMVSIPVILGRYSSDSILSENETITPAYTEDSAADDTETEKTPDFDLAEIKTFSDYKGLGGAAYTAGKLDVSLESKYYNFAVLAYTEIGADVYTYVEFITSSDIPDEYTQKSGGSVSGGITNFYVTDEGDIYYCGWLKATDKYTKDGIIGKYNQNTGKTEFLKVFDDTLFGMIMVTDSGKIMAAGDNGIYYQLDSKAETISETEDTPEWPGTFDVISGSPYFSQYGHEFNGKSYLLMDFMAKSCSKLCRMDLNTGETKIIYTTDEICTDRYGNIYSLYSFDDNNGSFLTAYGSFSFPNLLETDSIGSGHLESCDINLITDTFDYDLGKYRYNVYSPDGEKLYDFDLPDDKCSILGNISSESGENIFFISGDRSKVLCYEPETDQTSELTTLNDNFDISELNRSLDYSADDWYIFMIKSAKYDFLIWNQKFLYGYNINSDELTMITDTLDYYGMKIIRITADDDGNIYLTADGSNTLYSLVPHEPKTNSEENSNESDQTLEKKCNITRIEPQLNDEVRISSIEATDDKIKCVYYLSGETYGQNTESAGFDNQRAVEYDLSGNRLDEKMYPDASGFYQSESRKLINQLYVLVPSDKEGKEEGTSVYVYDYETTGKLGNISIRPSDFPELYFVSSAAECENGTVLCVLEAGVYGAKVSWSKEPEYFYKLAVVSPSGEIRLISDGTASEMFKKYTPEPSPQKDGTFVFVSDGKLYSYDTTDDILSVVCSLESDYCSLSGPVTKVNDEIYILTKPANSADRKDFYILILE